MGGLHSCLLKGLAGSLLVALVGCGGRTSTLDPDSAYLAPSRPSGGSTAGASNNGPKPSTGSGGSTAISTPPGKGGTSSTGTAGSTGGTGNVANGPATATAGSSAGPIPAGGSSEWGEAGAAGAGGATSLDPWVVAKCNDFCNTSTGPRTPCPRSLSNAECTNACLSELFGTGDPSCQKYGGTVLECLTAVYKNSSNCTDVEQLIAAKCGSLLASYESCASAPTPGPVPTPVPSPIPTPPPPSTCSTSGRVNPGQCDLTMKCTNGSYYSVYCDATTSNQVNCWCQANFADGSAVGSSLTLNESETFACVDSLPLCGFPQPGLK